MSRQVELERILQAWYDFEGCHPSEKGTHRETLNHLLDEARADTNLSRQDLIQALAERYRVFKTSKDKEMRVLLSRIK